MKLLLRLFPIIRPYRWQVILGILITLVITATQLVVPAIIRQVIDQGITSRQVTFLLNASLLLVGVGLLRAGLLYLQRYVSEWIANHIGYDLRNRLYDHIQHLPFAFHDHAQTGQLISRCIEDVRAVERFTGFVVIELLRMFLMMIGIVALLFYENALLAAIALLPLIPLILITTNFGQRISLFFYDVDTALGDLSAQLQENVSGAQVVRAFAREPYEIDRFKKRNRQLYHARVRVISTFARVMPTTHFLVSSSTILILWFGGRMVLDGVMTVGEVVAFNAYLLLLAAPAQQLTWLVNAAGEAVAGLRRSFEILDLQPDIQSPPNAVTLPRLRGQVEIRQVCFQYSQQKVAALEEIDLQVEPNQVVALIGATGSGKTSLINLIPRFYDPSLGSVLVDGYDIRQVDLDSLRQQIGIVLQTSLLFSASIAENIAYGHPSATQEQIEAAARAAQAHDFIQQLPEGYQTVVGERGITLSGGQRQRIAIARALLLDPRILILDDSTSSVDVETERLIQQALDTLIEGRTTFIIAHRLSTVRRADLILVMQNGRIAERGRHADLLQQGGLYREIYELQLKEKLADDYEEGVLALTPGFDAPARQREEVN
jgi:ATP-binding cassette subfamily B protein